MAGLGIAKKVGLTALGLATGGAAGNLKISMFYPERFLYQKLYKPKKVLKHQQFYFYVITICFLHWCLTIFKI